ncbi:GNAT family N-acetyltransferase [Xylanibacter muris]|mgnify:CR=1 FL=1|uniref:GNAT family N-acetyltransferase n=1 Tax=Xylanibacter muris TaxID=2736290 RepID=UPI0025A14EE8|nr:GNAT family N-acetyltransferase [Xylanibacter muris]
MKQIERCIDYDALTMVWLASVRATHFFLSDSDIDFYRQRIPCCYMPEVELYAIRNGSGRWCAFIGLANARVEMLFVHPDEMGKGYGSKLLQFAIDNKGVTEVDVNEQNVQALKFYFKHGFAIIGRDDADSEGRPYPILHLVKVP